MPTLETERLILRDFVASDWDALSAFLSDPSVTRYMHFSSWDEQKRGQWLASVILRASNPQQDAYDCAITVRSDGLLIGRLILGKRRHSHDPRMDQCGPCYCLHQ